MRHSPRGRIGTLVLAASVLLAAAPEAYGFGNCPFHAHDADQSASFDGPQTQHDGHSGAHQAGTSDSDQPCTWLADCHLCEFPPSLRADGLQLQLERGLELSVPITDALPEFLGPRRGLFELHLPNAPPAPPA